MFLSYLIPSDAALPPALPGGARARLHRLGLVARPRLSRPSPCRSAPGSSWASCARCPAEIEESAQLDGCTRFQTFRLIVIPVIVPGIITAGIFAFTLTYQEFIYALTFISASANKTISYGVTTDLIRGDVFYWGSLMAGALIGAVPVADRVRVQPGPLHPRAHRRRPEVIRQLTPKEERQMSKLTRRQFLGTTAAGAPRSLPHVWVRPAWAQPKQLSVLCLEPLRPRLRQVVRPVRPRSGRPRTTSRSRSTTSRTCTSRPRSRPRSPPSPATTSCSWWAPAPRSSRRALIDVQDLADKLGKKYGGWTPARRELLRGRRRQVPLHPRLLHRLPRPLPQGSVDRDRHAQRPRHLGRPAQGRPQAQGQGLPDRHRARAPQRLPQLLAGHHVVLRRLRGGQGRQDASPTTPRRCARPSSSTRRSTRRR